MTVTDANQYLATFNQCQHAAEQMLPLIGQLWRDRGVPTYVYGAPLYMRTPNEIMKAHRYARQVLEREINTTDTLPIVLQLAKLDLSPARVDIGKLLTRYRDAAAPANLERFIGEQLRACIGGKRALRDEPQDVVLYGFGRIGRLLARILVARMGGGEKFRLRAIVTRNKGAGDLEKRASLLRRDSIHGPFDGTITLDRGAHALVVNGNLIKLIYSDAPERVDYRAHDIHDAIVIDNTGKWRDRPSLSRHLQNTGARQVILTAPGKGDVPNVVFGVNHHTVDASECVWSAASCTTNAIVPVLKAIHDRFGIVAGHIESVHSYTNDQNLIDNFHPRTRRGRSAAINMVITETGAAKAVAKALPALAGKLTANAIRVPTPNGSLAILNLQLARAASREQLNRHLREQSLEGSLQYQIDYLTSPDIVSSDIVGNRHASVVDATATISAGERVVLYVWYDNEYGYTCQVIRLLEQLAGVKPRTYPA